MHLKMLQKKAIQKPPEATGDLTGNKVAEVSRIFSTKWKKYISLDKEIPKERCIFLEKREKYWWSNINTIV